MVYDSGMATGVIWKVSNLDDRLCVRRRSVTWFVMTEAAGLPYSDSCYLVYCERDMGKR